jgi:hypothetical protein
MDRREMVQQELEMAFLPRPLPLPLPPQQQAAHRCRHPRVHEDRALPRSLRDEKEWSRRKPSFVRV